MYRNTHERQVKAYALASERDRDEKERKRCRRETESLMSHAGPSFQQGISKELVDLSIVI